LCLIESAYAKNVKTQMSAESSLILAYLAIYSIFHNG